MPKQFLILTAIGDDRPGLVGELSATISSHQGTGWNRPCRAWAGASPASSKVDVAAEQVAALQAELGKLAGLKVTAEVSAAEAAPRGRRLRFSLVGHDRIGIVREVSQVLARHAVNVEELTTRTSSAPMSAETLFHAEAELLAGPGLDSAALVWAL